MKEKIFFYVKKTLVLFVAILSLLSLCFSFINISASAGVSINAQVSGFDMLPTKENFIEGVAVAEISPLLLFILISSIILIITSLINFFLKKDTLDLIISVVSIVLVLLYMCLSCSFVQENLVNYQDYKGLVVISTSSFVPLIIQGVLFVSYVIINMFNFNEVSDGLVVVKPENKKNKKLSNYVDDLKQLKELFDAEIITQEEFDIKKKEVLGL